jgi:methionine-gamma-lyase
MRSAMRLDTRIHEEEKMPKFAPQHGLSTIAIQAEEADNPYYAHIAPLYQTATFLFPDVETGQRIFQKEEPGFYYSRIGNPNEQHLAKKIAILEGIDLIRQQPDRPVGEIVAGKLFASGMAAITATLLARCKPGDGILAQTALYSHTFRFLSDVAPRYGVGVTWVEDPSPERWEAAFKASSEAVLVYLETPVNPTMTVVDLAPIIELAHQYGAWVMVDNTFASPYCQRPLTLGADISVHSTTKYLSGHGLVVSGAVISRHPGFIHGDLQQAATLYGGVPSPFDSWLANIGLKTFGIRMKQHCENAMAVAQYLSVHPKIARVHYPGLPDFPSHAIACKQMAHFGGMLSFELKGGYRAGEGLMNRLKLITLAVSLGNVDSLIQHPASMTHHILSPEDRERMGIREGLVRFSVGLEDIEDILEDLSQGLARV